MATLKVDLDVLQTTINTYNTEMANILAAKAAIKRAMTGLEASGWKSGAADAWFALLDEDWLNNIDFQIKVLDHLRDCMLVAKEEYYNIYEQQEGLKNYL